MEFIEQVQIQPSLEDFNAHIQRRDHQEKELKFLPQNVSGSNNLNDNRTFERKPDVSNTVQTKCTTENPSNHSTATLFNNEIVMKPPGVRMVAKVQDDDAFYVNRITSSASSSSNELPANLFTVTLPHGKPPSVANSISSSNSASVVKNSVHELSKPSFHTKDNFKDVFTNMGHRNANDFGLKVNGSTIVVTNSNAPKGACSTLNSVKKLEDVISLDDVLQLSLCEMDRILSYACNRVENEQEIIAGLSSLLFKIDSAINIEKFGSVTYGFGGANTNFNILVTAGKIDLSMTTET